MEGGWFKSFNVPCHFYRGENTFVRQREIGCSNGALDGTQFQSIFIALTGTGLVLCT
jgi:hypothetical protein